MKIISDWQKQCLLESLRCIGSDLRCHFCSFFFKSQKEVNKFKTLQSSRIFFSNALEATENAWLLRKKTKKKLILSAKSII